MSFSTREGGFDQMVIKKVTWRGEEGVEPNKIVLYAIIVQVLPF